MATHSSGSMAMTAQAEEYLEAICRISERGDVPGPTELSRELTVAPPSVLGMLRRLEEQELVMYSRKTGAVLTEQGQTCAERLRRHHRLAERLLTDLLGMPWARAHEVACRFEHIIDDEVEEYLTAALHHPTTCPHGNPLSGQSADHAGWHKLDSLAVGQAGTLRCITDESTTVLDYLTSLRLHPGIRITVCALAPLDGPLTLEIHGERHALSRELAGTLLVEMTEETE